MVNILDLIVSKIELFRLEQRYTKRRHRRSTFVSEAQYVDGEYIYSTPSPTKRSSVVQFSSHQGSSRESMSTQESGGRSPSEARSPAASPRDEDREREGRTPDTDRETGFGSPAELPARTAKSSRWGSARLGKRRSMNTVQEVRWEDGA